MRFFWFISKRQFSIILAALFLAMAAMAQDAITLTPAIVVAGSTVTGCPAPRAAIIDGSGPLGALLRISQAAERGDVVEIDSSVGLSDESGVLTPGVLAGLQVEAAEWFGAHRLE